MKCLSLLRCFLRSVSRPARGAWVEINMGIGYELETESRPARGAWVEIFPMGERFAALMSRPARGAWVEINDHTKNNSTEAVAPRKGRVG